MSNPCGNTRIILGIDPGLQFTGWGVISQIGWNMSGIACGVVKTSPKESLDKRLYKLFSEIDAVIKEHNPDDIAMEETFVNCNPKSSLTLGMVRGAIMIAAPLNSKPFFSYSPNRVKKNIVGHGHGTKEYVESVIKHIFPTLAWEQKDVSDALSIAVCHAREKMTDMPIMFDENGEFNATI
jgi:crossover junction endodeoxyribonuclease RuvC